MDRAALLHKIEPLIAPTPSQRSALRILIQKALVATSVTVPIESALRLAPADKDEFTIVIRDCYADKDVKSLAAKWEPARKLGAPDASLKETLRSDLIDLLHGRRPVYTGLPDIGVEQARANAVHFLALVKCMPTADAKKLLKAWDRTIRPATMPTTRDGTIGSLLGLLKIRTAA